jgi:hypothetical protein
MRPYSDTATHYRRVTFNLSEIRFYNWMAKPLISLKAKSTFFSNRGKMPGGLMSSRGFADEAGQVRDFGSGDAEA